ncbi:FtsK/SpoIIIE domain-containing protein [Actinotalea solisilvae]|uniref:FtsK/SpoIIIE domain-containing protein n=1 Tax=Actinotalea solisilvae TaxID=2072922 RepID=UPI0018F2374C|nr:FtsK/SpoIIIE domain-containing protein [Actinotalea solisilvae]
MHVTLAPGGDVELPDGVSLRRCRAALVRLTGAAELADAVLGVDGRALDDDHVTGVPPLVDGAVLAVGGGRPDPAALAAAAPWHVAVVAGPGAGAVAVPGRDGIVRVGRAPSPPDPGGLLALPDPAGLLALPDPAVSRQHAVLRTHAPRRGAPRWTVHDAGSANGTVVEARRGPRRVGRRGRRVRAGQPIRVGDGVVVVRTRDGRQAPSPEAEGRSRGTAPDRGASPATWVAPLVVAAGLAAVTGSPALLALGLAGPLAAGAGWALQRVRRRARTPSGPAPLGPDAAAAAVAAAAAAPTDPSHDPSRGTPEPPSWWDWAGEGLALVGPGRDAAARALVAAVAACPGAVSVLGGAPGAWRWLRRPAAASRGRLEVRWDGTVAVPPPGSHHLVLVDGAADAHAWWAARRPGLDGALVLAAHRSAAPAWCRWALDVATDGAATLHGPDGARPATVPTAGPAWPEAQARRLAAAWATRPPPHDDRSPAEPPPRVALADLLGDPGAPDVARTWTAAVNGRAPLRSLAVPLAATDRVVALDLLADGPHALVAGTTGAGKSELLQSWLLALALRHPPSHVALVLVDYKGGASFGACTRLPHVVGLVTDLDAERAARALAGLRAELARRKRLLARAGATDVEDLRAAGGAPPRLVVVVDEFRALAADLPDFVPGLVDLAAQGRSLGMHLVLATQRPAGAITAQMRANLALRVCLRVTDAADSLDVVEVPDAAALPVDRPGRAVLRRDASVETVQTAWAALAPGAWEPPAPPDAPVRARWVGADGRGAPPRGAASPTAGGDAADHAAVLAAAARAAAGALGLAAPEPVWLEPLPARLTASAARRAVGPPGAGDGAGLLLGLTDQPEVPARGALRWRPDAGPLAVAGRPGSGRTTALRTVVRAALAEGTHVHVVAAAGAGDRGPARGLGGYPGLGTTVGTDDPARLARLLLTLVTAPARPDPAPARTLVVVDDVGDVQRALDRLPRGAGAGLVERVLRGARAGLAVAVAGAPGDVVRLAQLCPARIVLAVDVHDAALLGVPPAAAGVRGRPGRGVLLDAAGAAACQVALPDDGPPPADEGTAGGGRPAPLRLRSVPEHVARVPRVAPTSGPGSWRVAVGLGGDDAGPVTLDVARGALVVGPPGSGRSTALAAVLAGLGPGVVVVALAPGPGATPAPAADRPLVPGTHRLGSGPEAAAVLRRLAAEAASGRSQPRAPVVVLADDVDALAPDLDDALAACVGAVPVVAAARTDRAAGAYRGTLAALRGAAPTLVLAPLTPGSADVAGVDLSLVADPDRPRAPGRGAVVDHGRAAAAVVPVQVAHVVRSDDVGLRGCGAAAPDG